MEKAKEDKRWKMSMIWLVSEKRFIQEYHNHIRNVPLKYVNWFVDIKTDNLKMYISAQGTDEVYCFVHRGGTDIMSPVLKDMLNEKGMVMGVADDSGNENLATDFTELINEVKGFKFNQVPLK